MFYVAIVQYQRKHSKILATIFLLLPTVLNSRVSHYSGRSHYVSPILNFYLLCDVKPKNQEIQNLFLDLSDLLCIFEIGKETPGSELECIHKLCRNDAKWWFGNDLNLVHYVMWCVHKLKMELLCTFRITMRTWTIGSSDYQKKNQIWTLAFLGKS